MTIGPIRSVTVAAVPVALLSPLAHRARHDQLQKANEMLIRRPTACVLTALMLIASPAVSGLAHAGVDTDFVNQLHTYGIYGPRDYHAWLGKIACNRLETGLDRNAFDSARFLSVNLHGASTPQCWQFLSTALTTYCPEQLPALSDAAAANH